MGSTIECVSTVPVAEAGSRGLHRVLVSACSAASTGELCGVCGSACVVTQIIEESWLTCTGSSCVETQSGHCTDCLQSSRASHFSFSVVGEVKLLFTEVA